MMRQDFPDASVISGDFAALSFPDFRVSESFVCIPIITETLLTAMNADKFTILIISLSLCISNPVCPQYRTIFF